MSFLPLLEQMELVLLGLARVQQELDGMSSDRRALVYKLAGSELASLTELSSRLVGWADRLGSAEPERTPIAEREKPLHAATAVLRRTRLMLEALTSPIGGPSNSIDRMDDRFATVCWHLRHASQELQVLRWLGPLLSDDPPPLGLPLLTARPLAALVGAVPAPHGLTGELRVDLPAFLSVRVVPGAVETVLFQLLDNAARHAPGAAIRIHASRCEDSAHSRPLRSAGAARACVLITVADQGPGIPDQQRAGLFEQELTGSGRQRHLSRGLWLCRCILRAHGGDLWLDRPERGTAVTSAWPLDPPHVGGRLSASTRSWPASPQRFAAALRFTREACGLTRAHLGDLATVADSTIRNIETGRHHPTYPIRMRLIAALENYRQVSGPDAGFFERERDGAGKPGTKPE